MRNHFDSFAQESFPINVVTMTNAHFNPEPFVIQTFVEVDALKLLSEYWYLSILRYYGAPSCKAT